MQQRKEVKEYQRETARRKLKERIRWGPSDDEGLYKFPLEIYYLQIVVMNLRQEKKMVQMD